jgi:hypothetical protein
MHDMTQFEFVKHRSAFDHLRWQWLIDVCKKEKTLASGRRSYNLRAVHGHAPNNALDVRNANRGDYLSTHLYLLQAVSKQAKIWQAQGEPTSDRMTWEHLVGAANLQELRRLYDNETALRALARSIRGREACPPVMLVQQHTPVFAPCKWRLEADN